MVPFAVVVAVWLHRLPGVFSFAAAWYSLAFQMLVIDISSRYGFTWGSIVKDLVYVLLASMWSFIAFAKSKSIQATRDKPTPEALKSES